MKRSEMIKLLTVKYIYFQDRMKDKPFHKDELMNYLLTVVEELGMLPPPNPTEIYFTTGCPEGENGHSWEDEDDS